MTCFIQCNDYYIFGPPPRQTIRQRMQFRHLGRYVGTWVTTSVKVLETPIGADSFDLSEFRGPLRLHLCTLVEAL